MLNQEGEVEPDLETMMLSLDNLEMEKMIKNRFKEFCFGSYLRGFYVYKDIWNPWIDEDCLKRRCEKENEHEKTKWKKRLLDLFHFTCLKQYLAFSSVRSQNFLVWWWKSGSRKN